MKLWPIVFAFHQSPTAISGAAGKATTAAPWSAARATNGRSRRAATLSPVDMGDERFDWRVLRIGPDGFDADAGGVHVRRPWRLTLHTNAGRRPKARTEGHDPLRPCERRQIVPLLE